MVCQGVVEMPSPDLLFPSTRHRLLAEALHRSCTNKGVSQNTRLEAGLTLLRLNSTAAPGQHWLSYQERQGPKTPSSRVPLQCLVYLRRFSSDVLQHPVLCEDRRR